MNILDDLPADIADEMVNRAALAGAFHMLVWLIAFYEAKRTH